MICTFLEKWTGLWFIHPVEGGMVFYNFINYTASPILNRLVLLLSEQQPGQ